jgi:hypothetical protein
MPATSVRDIVVHGDDLDVATHGRGFWVMDQMNALRELAVKGQEIASANAYLFKPGTTLAIRAGGQNGTPLPHEEPQDLNPPNGVVTYYWLKTAPSAAIKLEVVDAKGVVRACAASDTPVKPVDTEAINVQAVWQEPALPPSASAGMHRFVLGPPAAGGGGGVRRGPAAPAPKDACTGSQPQTPPARTFGGGGGGGGRVAPVLQPGTYTIRLTVDGKTYTQPAQVEPDPRGVPVDHANEDTETRS